MYEYIRAKSKMFLNNPEIYMKKDMLVSNFNLSNEDLDILKIGCQQILEGKGQTTEFGGEESGWPAPDKTKYGRHQLNKFPFVDKLRFSDSFHLGT